MARVVIMRTALGSGKYAVGDVVDVFADGASVGKRVLLNEWEAAGGTVETFPGLFYVVDVTNLSYEDAKAYLEASVDTSSGSPVVTRRRNWTVDLAGLNASLTPPSRRTLLTRFYLSVTRQEASAFITRK